MLLKSELRELIEQTLRDYLEGSDFETDIEDIGETMVDRMEQRFHVVDDEGDEFEDY